MHGGGKSASTAPVKKKRPPDPRRKASLPRLPASDYKIVCRPRGWNLNTFVPRQLQRAACDAVHVSFDVAQTEDSARVNPTNNTLTNSTPDRQRAAAYASLQTLRIEGRDFEVASYVAAPGDSVRGVIYQAFNGSSPDEVRQGFMNRNPGVIVVDARRLGQSKSIQITFQGTKIPSQIYYWGSIFRVHPYRPRVETCFNCTNVGHRADVCFKPKACLCRRCGENHPAPPEGELPTCKPVCIRTASWASWLYMLGCTAKWPDAVCIVCHGAHNTGSRNCKHRLVVRNQPKKKDDAAQPGGGHQSRSRARSSSMTRRGSKTRDRSSSFPPLMGAASKERKRSSSRGRSASRSKNKENAGPKRLAEASEVDTPQPSKAPSKLRSDMNALSERMDALSAEFKTFQNQMAAWMQQIMMDRQADREPRASPAAVLASSDPRTQVRVIEWAAQVADSHGLPAT
ncbi:hypothetical protein HPB47_018880 [Ixodes persulcatus]|uniref:Uncharacterized protein n=1 Tax=Ixodes persulcatus TaxID=34615 RepID=A0AC60QLJ4_IXOPE|nr:hypothetical protein HPB47_018880 [Ixodes persulcatus]